MTAAIQSRCTLFRFAPLSSAAAAARLDIVIRAEGLSVSEDGRRAILDTSAGDMRKVLNTLQSAAARLQDASTPIDAAAVYATLSLPSPAELAELLHSLLNSDFDASLTSNVPPSS